LVGRVPGRAVLVSGRGNALNRDQSEDLIVA